MYFTTADYNFYKLNIKQKLSVDKSAIARLICNTDLDKNVATLAAKAELRTKQNKVIKLQVFDSSYFGVNVILKMVVLKLFSV